MQGGDAEWVGPGMWAAKSAGQSRQLVGADDCENDGHEAAVWTA